MDKTKQDFRSNLREEKMTEITHEIVKKLLSAPYSEQIPLSADEVRRKLKSLTIDCIMTLQFCYDLAFLEGKIRCSEYHEAKKSLTSMGLKYGYLSSFVSREGGSNCYRFSYRRPTGTGGVHRIGMKLTKGTYGSKLKKFSSSELEHEIAAYTEEQYVILRDTGRLIKKS
jgi:hypothetical protein